MDQIHEKKINWKNRGGGGMKAESDLFLRLKRVSL